LTAQCYPKIADKVSVFVNKHRCFPDYQDILKIVQDCDEVSSVGYVACL